MQQYLKFLKQFEKGNINRDRTGTGTRSIFGYDMRFDISESFISDDEKIASKKHYSRVIMVLSGETNIGYLKEKWRKDLGCLRQGNLGLFSKQWRR